MVFPLLVLDVYFKSLTVITCGHVVAVLVMLIVIVLVSDAYCYCFSYHALFDLWYNHRVEKTAAAKKLGAEKGISDREAKWRLDINLFLDEIPRWEPSGPHCLYLYQRMFAHAEAVGWKEYNHGVHQGHQQPSPKRDVQTEVPAMELLPHEATREEILGLYHQVYQLKRNPGEVPCSHDMSQEIHIEILEMLKEGFQHRWGPALLEEEWRQATTNIRNTRTLVQAEFRARVQVTYDDLRNRHHDTCQEALAVMWDAHHQALAEAVLLEGHIERLSCSISHGHSGSHICSGSCWQSWSQGLSRSHTKHPLASPQAHIPPAEGHTGDAVILNQPHATQKAGHFWESSLDSDTEATPETADWSQPMEVDDSLPPSLASETTDWSQPKKKDLRGPTILDTQVAAFLSGEKLEDDPDSWECPPEPSFDNVNEWVVWQAEQVVMPIW